MSENEKLSEKFLEVIRHEGIVSITSCGLETHVVNTWNSYLVVTGDERILIPAYGFRKTEKNVNVNNNVILTLGTREVSGFKDYPGSGFVVKGTAKYFSSGDEFDIMKKNSHFLAGCWR